MELSGVITKVEDSDWAFPIVPVVKGKSENGKIKHRITGDFKLLNSLLQLPIVQMPTREKLLQVIKGAKFFSTIDLQSAYHQLKLTESSKMLATIATPWGLYRYNFLPQGISSAPGEFQMVMEELLKDLTGVACYYDDILVVGSSENQLKDRTESLLQKLNVSGLRINPQKSQFNKKSVIFLGHQLSELGIGIDPKKKAALTDCSPPSSKDELQSFLGMINYYNSFVDNFASITAPLYNLLRKDTQFQWSDDINKRWKAILEALKKAPILVPYDPSQSVTLTTDASHQGLGAVLSQNGRPVAFASKKLSPSQQKYSTLEKEAMSFFWATTKKFSLYLKGRHFIWQTDHQPLEKLLHPETALSKIASARIHRWARALMPYSYTIVGKRSKEIPVADGLSRLPFESYDSEDNEFEYVAILECNPISQFELREQTSISQELIEVIHRLEDGKPINHGPFFPLRNELSIHDGIVFYGNRPIIPETLRAKALDALHFGHSGIVQMKNLARSAMYWPGINKECERTVRSCEICQSHKTKAHNSTYKSWPLTNSYGERIHADFLGPIDGFMVLILVDVYTGWIDAYFSKSTTASETIKMMRKSFSRFGVPKLLVSDNAPQFVSQEFNDWLSNIGVKHLYSPPYHPESNGRAERAVRAFKEKERTMKCITDFQKRMDNILVALNSGSCADLKLYGRKLWSPVVTKTSFVPALSTKPVWYRVFDSNRAFWKKGIAVDTSKQCIQGEDLEGNQWRRSKNHIKVREEDQRCEDASTEDNQEKNQDVSVQNDINSSESKTDVEPVLRRSTRIRKPVDRYTPQ